MTAWLRSGLLVLGGVVAAFAICLVLPARDPTCSARSSVLATVVGCGSGSMSMSPVVVAVGGVLVAGGVVLLVASIAWQALGHYRLARALDRSALPMTLGGQPVGLVPGTGAAFVAGLSRPRIYCSEDLATLLPEVELRGVLLHERCHQVGHAPARLVLLAGVAPFIAWSRWGRAWLQGQRAWIEISADDHAVRHGVSRAALASAILKLQLASSAASMAGFSGAAELRVRALLGERPDAPDRSDGAVVRAAASVVLVVASACLWSWIV